MTEPAAVVLTGGCQCGAVRYEARPPEAKGYFCHCRMCQRAVGHVHAAFLNLPQAAVTWTKGRPKLYASSKFARRGFCGDCGTPLSFAYEDSENMDLTVGSLDDPSALGFKLHFGVESRVEAFRHVEGYPEYRSDEHQPLTDRWLKHYGKPPD